MKNVFRGVTVVLFVFLFSAHGNSQKVVGFFPNWYSSSAMNNINWDHMTDLVFCFAEPTNTGGVTLTNQSWLNTLVPAGHAKGVKVLVSFGGAAQGSVGWSSMVASNTYRQSFANNIASLVQTYNLDGINMDWEYPSAAEAANYEDCVVKIRAALDGIEGSMGKSLQLTAAVASLIWNDDGITSTFIQTMDYIYAMAFDDGGCSYCGGPNHSDYEHCENSFLHWTTGIPGAPGSGRGALPSQMVMAIPFYDNGGTFYKDFSGGDPSGYYNDADGNFGGRYYNSCGLIAQKAGYIMPAGAAGFFTWEIVQDRTDQYALLQCMYEQVMAYSCSAPVPDLGGDQSICGVGAVLLNSGVSTSAGRTFTWKKDGVTVVNASPSATTYSATSSGTYLVEVTENGCSNTDETVISGVLATPTPGGPYDLCNPASVTLDANVTGGGVTYQWQKNAVDIVGAISQTYVASTPGTFKVIVSASGCSNVNGSATVTSSLPTGTGDTICAAGVVNLAASESVEWYDAQTNGSLLNTAMTYNPSIASSSTYWIQAGVSPTTYTTLRSAFQGDGWQQNGNVYGTKFDVSQDLTLSEVQVNAGGGVLIVNVVGSNGTTVVASKNFGTVSAGLKTLSLDFSLTPGTYYINTAGSVSTTQVDLTPAANYNLTGVITVYGEAYWDWSAPYGDGYVLSGDYGCFVNMKVITGNSCVRVPVYAVIDAGHASCSNNPPEADFMFTPDSACLGASVTFSDASNGTAPDSWSWTFGSGASPASATGQGPHEVTYSTSGAKTVSLTATNGYGSDVVNKSVVVRANPGDAGAISGSTSVCEDATTGFSISDVADATTYSWTVPSGASIIAGQESNDITIDFSGAVSGSVSVVPTNICASGDSSTLAVTVAPLPADAGTIAGVSELCQGDVRAYSIGAVAGATSYLWSAPSGAVIASGQGSTDISVDYSDASGGSLSVTPQNSCGDGATTVLEITVHAVPEDAGLILGTGYVCSDDAGIDYAITAVNGASSYLWTVPEGATVASGQGTNAITVDFADSSGQVSVTPSNMCWQGGSSTLAVSITTGAGPAGAVAGDTLVCLNETGVWYNLVPVNGASGYIWTVPSGAVVVSGSNTNAIVVDFGSTGGDVTVTPTSSCGNGAPSSVVVTVEDNAYAPTVSGATVVCGAGAHTYSIDPVAGAVAYHWTVMAGALITDDYDTAIAVDMSGASSGDVTVVPDFSCGEGSAGTLAVTVSAPVVAPAGLTGSVAVCENDKGVSYSCGAVSGAAGYYWEIDGGAVIASGQGATYITVDFIAADTGQIKVAAIGSCDTSAFVTLDYFADICGYHADFLADATILCGGGSVTFTDNSQNLPKNASYSWNFGAGASPSTATGKGPHTVNFTQEGTYAVSLDVSRGNARDNETKNNFISVSNAPPAGAGTISGDDIACVNEKGVAYSIAPVAGADTYGWEVPSGATIVSGDGTTAILVDFAATGGDVSVTPVNDCGSGTSSALAVTTRDGASDAGVISGADTVCLYASGMTYSIEVVNHADSYVWLAPSGASIVSGQGTNSILMDIMSASSGEVAVTPTSICGNGAAAVLPVTFIQAVADAGPDTTVCEGSDLQLEASGGVGYAWSTGDTEAIIVLITSDSATYTVTVTDISGCTAADVVLVSAVAMPLSSAITGNETVPCMSHAEVYSVDDHAGSVYVWSVPPGVSFSGDGGASIIVDFDFYSGLDRIAVYEVNGPCTGAPVELEVSVCVTNLANSTSGETALEVFPNPTDGYFQVHLLGSGWIDRLVIYDVLGHVLHRKDEASASGSVFNAGGVPGVYLIEVTVKGHTQVKKLVVR